MSSTPSTRRKILDVLRYCFIAALGATVVAVLVTAQQAGMTDDGHRAAGVVEQATGTIYEDDPRWDCRTMGNQVCGPRASVEAGFDIEAGCYRGGVLVVEWSESLRGLGGDACAAPDVAAVGGSESVGGLVGCDRTAGPCTEGELTGVDLDGELMIARDLNGDGVISGDVEYGS